MHLADLFVGGTEMLNRQSKLKRKKIEKEGKTLKVDKYLPDTTGTENKDL